VTIKEDESQLISVKELAAFLRVHPAWIHARIRRRDIPHLKLGNYVKFEQKAIIAW
jgi:predicted DNA-binding transcriptional regulator AlpA